MKLQQYLKFSIVYLAFLLSWQMFGPGDALSGFFDIESGGPVTWGLPVLDLQIAGDSVFLPELKAGASSTMQIVLKNAGDLYFFVDIDANNFSPLAVCGGLDISAYWQGQEIYASELMLFNAINIALAAGQEELLKLVATANQNFSYASSACVFDLDFLAAAQAGFSDQEKIRLSVEIADPTAGHVVISKVYAETDDCHGEEGKNEWWELYNPGSEPVDLKKWKFCAKDRCRQINRNIILDPGQFLRFTHDLSTRRFYASSSPEFLSLGGPYLNLDGLDDMLALYDNEGVLVDQVNWGEPASNWKNYNEYLWPDEVPAVPEGSVLGRLDENIDTDAPIDWSDLGAPDCLFSCPFKDQDFACFRERFHACNRAFQDWLETILKFVDNACGQVEGLDCSGKNHNGADLPEEPEELFLPEEKDEEEPPGSDLGQSGDLEEEPEKEVLPKEEENKSEALAGPAGETGPKDFAGPPGPVGEEEEDCLECSILE